MGSNQHLKQDTIGFKGEVDEIMCGIIHTLEDILDVEAILWNSLFLSHIIQSLNNHLSNLHTCKDAAITMGTTILPLDSYYTRLVCHINLIISVCTANVVHICTGSSNGSPKNLNRASPALYPAYNGDSDRSMLQRPMTTHALSPIQRGDSDRSLVKRPSIGNSIPMSRTQSTPLPGRMKETPKSKRSVTFDCIRTHANTTHASKDNLFDTPKNRFILAKKDTSTPQLHETQDNQTNTFILDKLSQIDRMASRLVSKDLLGAHNTARESILNSTKDAGEGLPIHTRQTAATNRQATNSTTLRKCASPDTRWRAANQVVRIASKSFNLFKR
jgi:hypothetical protein